jgi:hypothetical protein
MHCHAAYVKFNSTVASLRKTAIPISDGKFVGPVGEQLKNKRGYSKTDLKKILGENVLRVIREVTGEARPVADIYDLSIYSDLTIKACLTPHSFASPWCAS